MGVVSGVIVYINNKMYRAVLVAVLIAGAVSTPVGETSDVSVGGWTDANAFVDGMLKTVNAKLPAKLNISDPGTFLHLKDCFAYGLDKGIHRVGNAAKQMVNGSIEVYVGAEVTLIGGQCNWQFLLNDGTVGGETSGVAVHMDLMVPISLSKHPKLLAFRMLQLNDLTMHLSGVGILDAVAEKLFKDAVDGRIHPLLVKLLNEVLPPLIQKVLDNTHI